ncbi:MAG TPA: hypothetical protein VE615_12275 [Gaiellaceae bacterium]|nr:hypothetical protein [Gaiellaceae bacterium]
MPVDQQEQGQQNQQGSSQGGAGGTAMKAAAAAAATSVAAIAARKAFSNRRSSNGQGGNSSSRGGSESVIGSVLSGGWDAARDALIPAAEDAAGAAGEYLARNGPEVLRDRIVPRFVDSFNNAREGSS